MLDENRNDELQTQKSVILRLKMTDQSKISGAQEHLFVWIMGHIYFAVRQTKS